MVLQAAVRTPAARRDPSAYNAYVHNFTMQQMAEELDVSVEDVLVVAQIELDARLYDEENETVTGRGRELLLEHFHGGRDPD